MTDSGSLSARMAIILGHPLPHTLHRRGLGSMTSLAARLAASLRPGDVLALVGPLAAGKTHLVQGLCRALGTTGTTYVTSPTYTVANVYHTAIAPIAHLDLYRLSTADDFVALGGEEYFDAEYITFVEWADRIPEVLPPWSVWLGIEPDGQRPDGRLVTIHATY